MATPILMPRQGQSVESCILVEWLVKPGDSIEEGASVANIETDKATFEVEAPASGTILDLFFEEGDDIPVLTHIGAIGQEGEDVSDLNPNGGSSESENVPVEEQVEPVNEKAAPEVETAPQPAAIAGGVGVSPRARNAALEKGVDTQGLAGSGPAGRVIERDVLSASAAQPRMTGAARAAVAAGEGVTPAQGSGPGGMVLTSDLQADTVASPVADQPSALANKEHKVSGIRKIIAERMRASLSQTAQLTLNRTVNASSMQRYRANVKAHGESLGLPNITFNDMIVYAAVQTLKSHPELNAHFLGDTIMQFGTVNVGIAVDTPRGLMVPVLKGAERMSLSGMSRGIKPLAESCIAGSPNPDDLSGGTFTITNLGSMGIDTFTPVLNAPEVAILGVGGLMLKPVKSDSGFDYEDFISLSLTIDHQAVDGAPGARFLQDLAVMLENIELALA